MTDIARRSLIGQGAAIAALSLAPRISAAAAIDDIDPTYRRSIVLDTLSFEQAGFDPLRALAAGITGVVLDIEADPRDTVHAVAALDAWAEAFAKPDSPYTCVLKAADFLRAKREGKFAIVLDCQDASILGTPGYANSSLNMDNLSMFYAKGLRVLQLTYTLNNGLGTGYADAYDAGLSRFGIAVVEEMNRLGMLIDTSHSSEKTTLDAISRSQRPVAVTHAGCYSLYPDKRNKSDLVIRRLADKGGYLGIYNMTLWMTEAATSSAETIVDHIDHAVKVGGIDLVGFGSDHEPNGDDRSQAAKATEMSNFVSRNKGWPGGEPIRGHVTASDMDGPERLNVLAHALGRRGYRSGQIEKVMGANFMRVFQATCG